MKKEILRFKGCFLGSENQKNIAKAMIAGIILTLIFTFLPFSAACEEISDNVMRLHILANSDSDEDQQLKLKVRDAVLTEAYKWYGDAKTLEEANSSICTHLQSIEKAAQNVLKEENSSYDVKVEVTDMHFSTRDYEDFSLPAGKYRTLRVSIGEAEGKNWWCMVYPSLCVPVSNETQTDAFSNIGEAESDIITNPGDYKVKLKIVEIFEDIRSFFDN